MRILTETVRKLSTIANSNAGSQIIGSIVGVGTASIFAYIIGRGERERELEENKAKAARFETQLQETNATLKACQERNSKLAEREIRDIGKIGKLRSEYNLCEINKTLIKSAFENSYCIIRNSIPENINAPDTGEETDTDNRPLK
ncbi:MAG TPA: hypothetical protein VD770_04460 [Coxiellaceae bacterium]|nr:hypothetical protein [Coxiellaceae bacterium]